MKKSIFTAIKRHIYKVRFNGFMKRLCHIMKDNCGSNDMTAVERVLDKLIPITTEDGRTIIKIGKINFVVREHYPETGKTLDEVLENLAVEKCRKIS